MIKSKKMGEGTMSGLEMESLLYGILICRLGGGGKEFEFWISSAWPDGGMG
jgi:hypothetical protein